MLHTSHAFMALRRRLRLAVRAVAPSAVLLAMGRSPQVALGAVRLSLGRSTSEKAVDLAAKALIAAWRKLKKP